MGFGTGEELWALVLGRRYGALVLVRRYEALVLGRRYRLWYWGGGTSGLTCGERIQWMIEKIHHPCFLTLPPADLSGIPAHT